MHPKQSKGITTSNCAALFVAQPIVAHHMRDGIVFCHVECVIGPHHDSFDTLVAQQLVQLTG